MIDYRTKKIRIWDIHNKEMIYFDSIISVLSDKVKKHPDCFIINDFVGCKDSFGNDLYEGDIVKYSYKFFSYGEVYHSTGVIYWNKYKNSWGFCNIKDFSNQNILLSDFFVELIQKKGNIYEGNK